MTYQALARKWRPQDFSSIIGQQPVVTALRNAIRENRIAQAYLFSGIRGVGKTTAARVFAKALNCETRLAGGPDAGADPCNECDVCREITRGSDLDVIEIDAATYSKVEQVRELTESLRYGPARGRYKVVVIDEIHRLSRQAFDALLKIVEEPPPHLVFVFATTEIEVVPATILSRCQEFHFRRVPGPELVAHLRTLCEAEGITASDRALRLLARAGEGSVRDSVALLDQLATFGSGEVTEEAARRLLGGLDFALYHDLLRDILAGDPAAVSDHLRRVEAEAWDPRRTHAQFLGYCRDALHAAVGADPAGLDLPEEDAAALAELAAQAGYENLLRLLHQLLKSEETVRRADNPTLAVEIAWLRAAELPKLIGIEALLAAGPATGSGDESEAPTRPPTTPRGAGRPPGRGDRRKAEPQDAPQVERARAPSAASQGPRLSSDPTRAFLEIISHRKQPLAARLRQCRALALRDGVLEIAITGDDPLLKEALERRNNRDLLTEAVREVWGEGTTWSVVEGDPETTEKEAPAADADVSVDHPIVQSALDLFGGTIESVEESPARRDD